MTPRDFVSLVVWAVTYESARRAGSSRAASIVEANRRSVDAGRGFFNRTNPNGSLKMEH